MDLEITLTINVFKYNDWSQKKKKIALKCFLPRRGINIIHMARSQSSLTALGQETFLSELCHLVSQDGTQESQHGYVVSPWHRH